MERLDLAQKGAEAVALAVTAADLAALLDHGFEAFVAFAGAGKAGGEGALAGGGEAGVVGDGELLGQSGLEGELPGNAGEEAVDRAETEAVEVVNDVSEGAAAVLIREMGIAGGFGELGELGGIAGGASEAFEQLVEELAG